MKLRNKKTGGLANIDELCVHTDAGFHDYYSLAELNEEWEDVPEEPKGSALHLMILTLINFIENEPDEDKVDLEDCKQMLEKLKAFKRLKDKGFRFDDYHIPAGEIHFNMEIRKDSLDEVAKDMAICFGGEE